MNAPARDIARQVAKDLRMPPPRVAEGGDDVVASAGPERVPVWSLTEQALGEAAKPGLRGQGWFWVAVSLFFHTVMLGAAVSWGMFATEPVETPPVLMEFSLDGLPGIGGSGGDGREAGSTPAAMADAGAAEQAAAPEEPVAAAAEPELASKEAVAPPEEPKPVVAERETPPPPKVVQPSKPAPKPKARPKPARRPKIAAKAEAKNVAPAAPQHVAAAGTATASATGSGLGQGVAGQGAGKGPGQGDGAPGTGEGSGGAGGGTDTGLFGRGNGPRFRHRYLPHYPSQAKMENKEGRVKLRLTIDASGVLRDVDVLGHDGLEFVREAVHAIQSSTFYPATHCGHPILSRALLVIRFKLG